jgi:hypothetical protein
VIQLQGDQRKDVQEFLVDKKEGLELDAKTIKVSCSWPLRSQTRAFLIFIRSMGSSRPEPCPALVKSESSEDDRSLSVTEDGLIQLASCPFLCLSDWLGWISETGALVDTHVHHRWLALARCFLRGVLRYYYGGLRTAFLSHWKWFTRAVTPCTLQCDSR